MPGMYEHSNKNRRKPTKFERFMSRYFPSLCLLALAVVCVVVVITTIQTISNNLNGEPNGPVQMESTPSDGTGSTDGSSPSNPSNPSGPVLTEELVALMNEANFVASGYNYTKAIEMLQSYPGYEQFKEVTDRINEYTTLDSQLVSYTDLDNITHIFFHSLIVDTKRAFDGDGDSKGYNLYMATISEFNKIMEQMYERGYVLVSPYDIAYETTDASGKTIFTYGNIRLPAGKKPFLLSQDDVNYYSYMIGTGDGKDKIPIFADTKGDGFASKIVIGEDGFPTCEYMDAQGNIHYGDYDLVPLLEKFIQKHPDFSYHGARAMLGVTGYEGVLGYRTKPSYAETIGQERWEKEVEEAKKVAECLKEHGWLLVSHSYGHPAYGNLTASRVEADSQKWEDTCEYIVGKTDIILYPHGSDINGPGKYTMDNGKFKALYEDGYRYFFNVDSKVAWIQIGENYFRGGRRNIDGYRMYHYPEKLEDLFDVSEVFDPDRPTPVPTI